MPGKSISDNRPTSQGRPQVPPGEAGPVKDRYSKNRHPLLPADRSSRPLAVDGANSRRASEGSRAFRFDRESLRRPPPRSALAAELLGVEKTLDHNVADVLDRRNLPLLP